jgi:hypothetical protein
MRKMDREENEAVCDYMLAQHGEWLGVYPQDDRKWGVGRSIGDEIEKSERPLIVVECPGENESDYTEHMNEVQIDGETLYREDGETRLWTHEELVRDAVDRDGDIKENLLDYLVEKWEEVEEIEEKREWEREVCAEIAARERK